MANVRRSMANEERPNRIYAEVEAVLMYLQGAQKRAESGLTGLRAKRADTYAIEALERALEEIVESSERLRRDGLRLDRAAELTA
jgi:hypothetical protein